MKKLIKKKLTSRIYEPYNHEITEEEVNAIEATNGDMIKSMFPNGTESIGRKKIYYSFYPNGDMEFNITWWNAPYKKEVE